MRYIPFLSLFVLAAISIQCGQGTDSGLPTALGKEFEIVIVGENAQKNDPHVIALQELLTQNYPMLNQPEKWFTTSWIDIKDFGNLTEKNRNIIFLANTDKYGEISGLMQKIFGGEAIENMRNNPDKYTIAGHNVWANPQQIMYLAAEDPQALADKIKESGINIVNHFDAKEFLLLQSLLFEYHERFEMEDQLIEKHKLKVRVPEIYNFAKMGNKNRDSINQAIGIGGLEWIYAETNKTFSNLLIYYEPYTSVEQLNPDHIIAMRDSVGKYYVPCSTPNSYMGTELSYPDVLPIPTVTELNGNYMVKTLGFWKAINGGMGGPFVNFAVVDKKNSRIVYLDGSVFAPGTSKKSFISRIKAIISTVEFQ